MSPRSFLVSRQNHFARSSPSSSPIQSPGQSPSQSPRASPQHSPSHSPSRSPPTTTASVLARPTKPSKSAAKTTTSSPFSVFGRRRDDSSTWDSIPSNNLVPPSRTATATTSTPTPSSSTSSASSATSMSATVAAPPRGAAVADVRRLIKADAPLMPFTPTKSMGAAQTQTATAFLPDERPTTPTSPVQIPVKAARHETAHPHAHAHAHAHHAHTTKHRHHQHQPQKNQDAWRGFRQGQAPPSWGTGPRRPSHNVHNPESISPSVAALLAVTTIPRSRSTRSLRQTRNFGSGEKLSEKRMTVKSIIDRAQEVEQEFSFSLSKSPLDVLLTAPEDLEDDDDVSISDSTLEPGLSTRTVSLESMPSLADSFATGTISSYDSPRTPNRGHGSVRKARPTRRSMTPVSSPPGEREGDPLSATSLNGSDSEADDDVDNLDFRVFQSTSPDPLAKTTEARFPLQPLRSAFKSNLTASLRALRNAARSFSNLNLTSIPPEDFLTRSILTIDPRIPYTDERRPPPLEEEPSPALRRYLNPSTGPHIDPRHPAAQVLSPALASASLSPVSLPTASAVSSGLASTSSFAPNNGASPTSPGSSPPTPSPFTASIQMQTYRVHRTKGMSSRSSNASGQGSSNGGASSQASGRHTPLLESDRPPPGPRQRELRENSDFIRIAVMEMAMRRAGKLDDRKPGRARLALPPRKMAGKPYVVGTDGVPARWVSATIASD
ncbi:hypothetical protein SBRCBS47491_002888 [Sporothrix bragantina]|uniref:Uncharacterized protein n=1 Tax=Sporothrix bragantina TaxID=671064 RepID=A0ABP0BAW5_9PEZI